MEWSRGFVGIFYGMDVGRKVERELSNCGDCLGLRVEDKGGEISVVVGVARVLRQLECWSS